MADKLFPTPEATVQFQMPNENKDLLDLMDNMIKMKIQQQNEEYKQKRQQYELTQLENEEKRNQFLIENIKNIWGEEPVNKLKSQGFVDAVSLQQYLQQDFTNNYLKQAQKDLLLCLHTTVNCGFKYNWQRAVVCFKNLIIKILFLQ